MGYSLYWQKMADKNEKEIAGIKKQHHWEDEEPVPSDLFAAIDEAIDHVDLISAIDEAVMHADLLSAIDEAVAFTTKQETTSWGTITLSACGVAAAIGGAGYLVTRTNAFKKENDDVYESLV